MHFDLTKLITQEKRTDNFWKTGEGVFVFLFKGGGVCTTEQNKDID